MYTQSHHEVTVERDENGDVVLDENGNTIATGYDCVIQTPHTDDELYTTDSAFYYDAVNKLVNRGNELCDNIYVHGYNETFSKNLNEKRAELGDFMNRCIFTLNLLLGTDIEPIDQIGVMSQDELDKYGCDNYTVIQGELNCNHEHTDECKKAIYTCGGITAKHKKHTEKCISYTYDNCTHQHESLTWGVDENGEISVNCGCYDPIYVCKGHCGGHITPVIDVTIDYDWKNLCALDAYKTTYFLTKAEIMEADAEANVSIKIGEATSDLEAYFGGIFDTMNTIPEWQDFWNRKCSAWFSPCPRSLLQVYASAIDTRIKLYVKAEDWLHKKIQGLMGTSDTTDEDTLEKEMKEASESAEDVYGWNGWYLDDGETLDDGQLDVLTGFYGVPTDFYSMGREMWENFEVVFPIGTGYPLTVTQKDEIIKQVKEQWKANNNGEEIPTARLAVIQEALDKVGCYSYDLARGHENGLSLTSIGGLSECSGFVGGVIRRAYMTLPGSTKSKLKSLDSLTSNYTCTASGYCHYKTSPKTGDIIAHNNGGTSSNGTSYSGHVLIYLGYLDGVDGYSIIDEEGNVHPQEGAGYYVIHCTSKKGSVLEKKSSTQLKDIPYTYTPVFY